VSKKKQKLLKVASMLHFNYSIKISPLNYNPNKKFVGTCHKSVLVLFSKIQIFYDILRRFIKNSLLLKKKVKMPKVAQKPLKNLF
jgi:hypothetical protein